ncbi:unnamed protein product [Heligmosomoides polygyrus]|uniref:SET domain-containing protein n=1 Tax=Heligmosomoides polygyrus TaxID=6339 RepID=A0A183GQW3_HELPZ|nr:unnamed protein product [Heligmosomoides polygyrus]
MRPAVEKNKAATKLKPIWMPDTCVHPKLFIYWGSTCSVEAITCDNVQLYLPGFETVVFHAGEEQQALAAVQNRLSTLTVYFAINKQCSNFTQVTWKSSKLHGNLPEDMVDSATSKCLRLSCPTRAGNKSNARRVLLSACIL